MEKVVKETVTTEGSEAVIMKESAVEGNATGFQTFAYLIYFFFGFIDILLVTRFILKLFGASTANSFVDFVYGITGILVAPFAGIFQTAVSEGLETSSFFEPATLIAMIVYSAIAWGVVKLIQIASGKVQTQE